MGYDCKAVRHYTALRDIVSRRFPNTWIVGKDIVSLCNSRDSQHALNTAAFAFSDVMTRLEHLRPRNAFRTVSD